MRRSWASMSSLPICSPIRLRAAARVLDGVAQRGRGVDGGEHFAARRLDISLEALDANLQVGVGVLFSREVGRGLFTFADRARFGGATLLELDRAGSRRASSEITSSSIAAALAPSVSTWCRSKVTCCCSRPMASSRACACSRASVSAAVGLRQFETQRLGGGLDLGKTGGGERLTLTGVGEPRARRLDRRAERAIAQRELHLLPAAQLLAQPAVAPGLGRLALQRAALLLDFEHDVVDAGQVLLRRLELELRGAPPALVLW